MKWRSDTFKEGNDWIGTQHSFPTKELTQNTWKLSLKPTCNFLCLSVVFQSYSVNVMDENVLRGNTAIVKCHIPSFVADFVFVDAWIANEDDEKSEYHYHTQSFGRNHRHLLIIIIINTHSINKEQYKIKSMQGYTTRCFIPSLSRSSKFSMGLTAYLIPFDPSLL